MRCDRGFFPLALLVLTVGALTSAAQAPPGGLDGKTRDFKGLSKGFPKDKKGPLDVDRGAIRGGIQWFASWESGWREAQRSGRPILLVSAAPHCAGVSGVW